MKKEEIQNRFSYVKHLVGNTPMYAIEYTYKGEKRAVYAKAENLNMTGSIKDRMAFHILKRGYESGCLEPGDMLAEATSGNTGIALAMVAAANRYYNEAMKRIDLVVAGIGEIQTCWVLEPPERLMLENQMGAIGDILFDIYGDKGTPIAAEPAAAVFPFTIRRLQQMVQDGREVTVVSTGKIKATYHALACLNPFVTGIITDEDTAASVLEYAPPLDPSAEHACRCLCNNRGIACVIDHHAECPGLLGELVHRLQTDGD